jgi:hypothetical protein
MTAKAKAKSHRKRLTFDALAGAMSGCLARFAVGPLDVLKIRFQVLYHQPIRRAFKRSWLLAAVITICSGCRPQAR